jgi:stalled ribosome rescue protein Dom34
MRLSVIWIDRQCARVFHVSDDRMERKYLGKGHVEHHTHRPDARDHQREEIPLFKEAAKELSQADRTVIIGPGMAKHHFQNFLIEHYPLIAKKIAGFESVDHPTDAQIAALAQRYFERATA